jgi:hypothetical protein
MITVEKPHSCSSSDWFHRAIEGRTVCHNHVDMTLEPARRIQLAKEAKAIVALCFRNGPIEDVHAGQLCPVCARRARYSRISDEEMLLIMRNAVDQVYRLLLLKVENPEEMNGRFDSVAGIRKVGTIPLSHRLRHGKRLHQSLRHM